MKVWTDRIAAVEACKARFLAKPFRWGVADCVTLARHDLHSLRIKTPMLKGVAYRSELGALKAFRKAGYADLIEAVDALGFARIPPASAWAADLVAVPCEDGPWGAALTVATGDGGLIGFADGIGTVRTGGGPDAFVCAWRVE